ncbi:MAG: glycoside hydrolase family 3, partial [Gemmatimonadota bacterium]|nr:glycoside hydrolase family 3 [Gemmatimonadota bacterium]
DIQPGGVVLFDYDLASKGEVVRNITSPRQLRRLTSALQDIASYFIAVDAEGGYVNRLKEEYEFSVSVPSAQELGRQSPGKTKKVADALARELKDLGINWNFAPVVDVNIDSKSPAIGAIERSFSDVPRAVVAHANVFIKAHQEQQVIPTLKHFPGHGSAAGDTHLGVTDVTETYRRAKELLPYRKFIQKGYGDPILTAHIVNRKLDKSGRPATLSYDIMTRLLRYELGFDGVVISDDMQMGAIVEVYGLTEAVVEAVKAGVDMILLANQIGEYNIEQVYEVKNAIVQAVADGVVGEDRICESFIRIQRLKQRFGI